MDGSKNPWGNFAGRYGRLRSPLAPSARDIEAVAKAIRSHAEQVVLLGVTPGLARLGDQLTAFDNSESMIREIWPGDRIDRKALFGDWLALPVKTATISAVIGDGSLNAVGPHLLELLNEIRRILRPGGIAATRVFCSPEIPEPLSKIVEDVASGTEGNFHAVKWRIAMSLAHDADDFTVPVAHIRSAFRAMWSNEDALLATTGWARTEVQTIDFYDGAAYSLCFPTERALAEAAKKNFAEISFRTSQGYALSERCPICVLQR